MTDVRLKAPGASYVERALASGKYADASELVEEALAIHALQFELDEASEGEVHAAVAHGLADLESGRFESVDSLEAFKRAVGLDDE